MSHPKPRGGYLTSVAVNAERVYPVIQDEDVPIA